MNHNSQKRIVLADDHSMFRQGIKALLEGEGYKIVGEAADGHETVKLVRDLEPDLVTVDIGMPLLNGIDTAREIQKRSPRTRTLILTMFEDDAYIMAALKAGARGYVLKAQAASDLITAIQEVLKGAVYLSPAISDTVVKASLSPRGQPEDLLTDRERHVLQLIAEGMTTKEVASVIGVSVKTAESHRTRIMQKLDVHGTAGLVRHAIRIGLIEA